MQISELETKLNLYGYELVRCPVCDQWKRKGIIRMHISSKHDQEHRDYYLANTKEVTIVKREWL